MPDDDLAATATAINRLFEICAEFALDAAQPALTWDSYFSHVITLRNCLTTIRFTNFVEIMAPCVSSKILGDVVPLFKDNVSGFGLDHIWAKLARNPQRGIAIIDAVTVRYTRPVGGPNYKHLEAKGMTTKDEFQRLASSCGLEQEPEIVAYKARLKNGLWINPTEKQLRRFPLRLFFGFFPAVFFTPQLKRPMLRRMAGMVWKGLWNLPDRVADKTILEKWIARQLSRLSLNRRNVAVETRTFDSTSRASYATICQLEAEGFRFSHIKGVTWHYIKDGTEKVSEAAALDADRLLICSRCGIEGRAEASARVTCPRCGNYMS